MITFLRWLLSGFLPHFAVAFDAVSTGSITDANTISVQHTPAGALSGVGVGLIWRHGTLPSISSINYGGQAMSQASAFDIDAFMKMRLYGLGAPPTGVQNAVINFSSNCRACVCVISVTGGDTSTVFSNVATNSNSGATVSTTVNSAADELVMDIVGGNAAVGGDPGAGQTERCDFGASDVSLRGSTEAGASPNVTMSWSGQNSANWYQIAGSFKAAAAGADAALTGSAAASGMTAPSIGIAVALREMLRRQRAFISLAMRESIVWTPSRRIFLPRAVKA